MRNKIVFYIIILLASLIALLFFRKTYLELNSYVEVMQRHNKVLSQYQNLSGLITKAAFIDHSLIKTNNDSNLFFVDSNAVIKEMRLLKTEAKDSINTQIINELEINIKNELPWVLQSSVPDSIIKEQAQAHIAAFKKIHELINKGSNRTSFLIEYRNGLVHQITIKIIIWMFVFILFATGIILFISIHFFRQRTLAIIKSKELAETEMQFKQALDNMIEGVQIHDFEWRYTYINNALVKYSKYSREQLLGFTLLEKYPGIEKTELFSTLQRCMTQRTSDQLETDFIYPDGTKATFELSIQPTQQGIFILSVDVTERKKMQENQALIASIVNSTEDAIISKTLDGIITTWNKGAEKIFGYSANEMIGKHISMLIPSQLVAEEEHIIEKISNDEATELYETQRIRKDGSLFYSSLSVSPIKDSKGNIIGATKILRDITKQKNAEQDLRRSSKEIIDYKYSLDESSIVAITNQKGIIKYANDNFCKISKYNREELIGQDHRIINSGYHSKDFIKNIWTTIANGKIWKGEMKNKAKDGTIYWVDTTIVPFLGDDGKPYQYVAIRSDITERKNAEEQLHQLNEELDQKVLDRTNELLLAKNELADILESIRFLATIAENIQDPIISSDINFSITKWNKAAEKLLEWKSEEVIGKNTTEVLQTKYTSQSRAQILAELDENDFWQGEVIYHSKSGKPINALVTVSHLRDKNENISGILVLIKDITERITLEKQLQEFEHFFKNSNDLSCIANKEGFFEIINPSFEKMLGYSNQDFFESPFINYVHPDDIAATLNEYERLKSGATVIHFNNRYRKKDGNYLLLDWNATPNPFTGKIYCIARDITDRKKAEEALNRLNAELEQKVAERTEKLNNSEKQYRHLFTNNPMCMWVIDLHTYQFLDVNQMAILQYGYSREEFLSMSAIDIRPEEEKENFVKLDRSFTIDSENYNKGIWKHKKKDGTIILVEIFVHEIVFEGKKARIILSEDITKRLEAEKLLAENLKELERSNRELEEFAYIASHDLQEPLRMVVSYMQLLERRYKGKLDNDADEFIHYAVDGASRMKRLINDLLNYSRLNKEGQISQVNMNEIVNEVIQNLSASIKESNTTINYPVLPIISSEKTQMVQLFQNLISNAIKFSKDKRHPEININFVQQANYWQFSISDNGIGIDQQYSDKVFIIFKQLHTKSKFGGTGIGLAIAKKIVERHGGKIWFESEPGKGTTFYFTLKNMNL